MRKLFTKYYKKILATLGVVFILSLNFAIFRFQSYAIFRDYIIVKDQDFIYNNINPILYIYELFQNKILEFVSLENYSTFYFTLLFTVGFSLIFISIKILYKTLGSENILLHETDRKQDVNPIIYNFSHRFFEPISTFGLSLFLTYNPFVLERFLMGQDRVLIGYFILLPTISITLDYLSKVLHKQRKRLLLGFLLLLMAIYSIHAIGLFLIFYIAIFLTQPKYYKDKQQLLNIGYIILIMVLGLILNYDLFRTGEITKYVTSIYVNQATQEQIVSAFSARALFTQNLFTRVLIGSASWQTFTFFEIEGIKNSLGNFSILSIYFNQWVGFGFILGVGSQVYFGLRSIRNSHIFKNLHIALQILFFSSLTLSFGYTLGLFKIINQLFFLLPGSYVFREPGKFYMMTLAALMIILVIFFKYLKITRYKIINLALLYCFCLSNLIAFIPLSNNLNYIKLPEALDRALNNCQDKTVLFLPNVVYPTPKFSKTFIPNPFLATRNDKCSYIKPLKVEIQNQDFQKFDLDYTYKSNMLDQSFEEYFTNLPKTENGVLTLDVTKQNENIDKLYIALDKQKIDWVVVDRNNVDYNQNLLTDLSYKSKILLIDNDYALVEIKLQ